MNKRKELKGGGQVMKVDGDREDIAIQTISVFYMLM